MTTTLYLIRHGETDWNVEHRWQGHRDVPLNTRGYRQAELVAQRLRNEQVKFRAIYSSDLTRAYQTAWEIGSCLGVAVQFLPALREIDLGTWSGLTRDEIKDRYPDEFERLVQGEDVPRGGAETSADLHQRVLTAMHAMITQHEGHTIAFVTHGGVIRSIVNYVHSMSGTKPLPQAHIGNTSISIIRCMTPDRCELAHYNDVQHLAEMSTQATSVPTHPDDMELTEG